MTKIFRNKKGRAVALEGGRLFYAPRGGTGDLQRIDPLPAHIHRKRERLRRSDV